MSATFLVTAPTFHRKRLFQNERYGEALTEILMRCRQEHDLLLHDYVIMPDHVHLLVTGKTNSEALEGVRSLQKTFAENLRREFGYNGEVWETKFREGEIHSATEYAEAARHIHSNPVRVGFCEKPAEYRMSSRSSRWILDPVPESLRLSLRTA